MVAADKLTMMLKTFARTLAADYPIQQRLDELCADVAGVLEVDGAGIMLEDPAGDLRFVAASNELVRAIEALQIEFGEGPCRHAYQHGEVVLLEDLKSDTRFPLFSPRAHAGGMESVHSFPLKSEDACIGALNLYTHERTAFDREDVETAVLLSDVATAYIINSRNLAETYKVAGQLQSALDTRVVIEQAKGKLSEQLGVDVTDAFEILRRHARNNGVKLRDVAADVVAGTLRLSGPG